VRTPAVYHPAAPPGVLEKLRVWVDHMRMPHRFQQWAIRGAVGIGVGTIQVQAVVLAVAAQPGRARLVDQWRGFQEAGEHPIPSVHPAGHHFVEQDGQRLHMQVDGSSDQDRTMPRRTMPADLPGGLRHHPVQECVSQDLGD
jgi:anti-sigma factor RsiW